MYMAFEMLFVVSLRSPRAAVLMVLIDLNDGFLC